MNKTAFTWLSLVRASAPIDNTLIAELINNHAHCVDKPESLTVLDLKFTFARLCFICHRARIFVRRGSIRSARLRQAASETVCKMDLREAWRDIFYVKTMKPSKTQSKQKASLFGLVVCDKRLQEIRRRSLSVAVLKWVKIVVRHAATRIQSQIRLSSTAMYDHE